MIGFPWETLTAGSKIVDVGGGIGSQSLPIAQQFRDLKFVIQDLRVDRTQKVNHHIWINSYCELSFNDQQYWENFLPGSVEAGRLVVQSMLPRSYQLFRTNFRPPEHDFFTPQPVKDASIFLIRGCIHNWPNKYAIKILQQLRAAAIPNKTRLLMIDNIVSYACRGTVPEAESIPGASSEAPPEPLLQNLGRVSVFTHSLDMLYVSFLLSLKLF